MRTKIDSNRFKKNALQVDDTCRAKSKSVMTTFSTGAKLPNSPQNSKSSEDEVSNPLFRLIYAIVMIAIEWGMTHLKSKAMSVDIMLSLVRVVVFVLFLLLLVDVFYIFAKGKSIFEDLLQFEFGSRKDESEDFFFSDNESLKHQFSSLRLGKQKEGKDTFQIEGSTEPAITLDTIKANMNTAKAHAKQRGSGEGGINIFTYRKWTYYYDSALKLLKEREEFYADGTHRIFLKDKDGHAIICEGTYSSAMQGALEYLRLGYVDKAQCTYHRFPQAEHSDEFRKISFNQIYEAEKINHNQTIIKNQYETWKA